MRWLRTLPKRVLLWMIRYYRAYLSPQDPALPSVPRGRIRSRTLGRVSKSPRRIFGVFACISALIFPDLAPLGLRKTALK